MIKALTICIVDDHDIVRQGLRKVFSFDYGFDVIGEAGSCADARELLKRRKPEVLILDQMLGDGSGLTLADDFHKLYPGLIIILLTAFPVPSFEGGDERESIAAYLFKDQSSEDIRKAVWEASGNQGIFGPKETNRMLGSLSPREKQILNYISHGLQNKEISSEIGISEKTVRNTVSNMFRKLNVNNRTEATRLFLHH